MIEGVKDFFRTHGHLIIWFHVLNVISGFLMFFGGRFHYHNTYINRITVLMLVTTCVGVTRARRISSVTLGILYGALGFVFFLHLQGQGSIEYPAREFSFLILGIGLWCMPPIAEAMYQQRVEDKAKESKELLFAAMQWYLYQNGLTYRANKLAERKADFEKFRFNNAQKLVTRYLMVLNSKMNFNDEENSWYGEIQNINDLPGAKKTIKEGFRRIYVNDLKQISLDSDANKKADRLKSLETEYDHSYIALAYFVENRSDNYVVVDEQERLFEEWDKFKLRCKSR